MRVRSAFFISMGTRYLSGAEKAKVETQRVIMVAIVANVIFFDLMVKPLCCDSSLVKDFPPRVDGQPLAQHIDLVDMDGGVARLDDDAALGGIEDDIRGDPVSDCYVPGNLAADLVILINLGKNPRALE